MTDLTVNGRPVRFDMDPQTPLLWALRDAANLTGTKYGCGVGDCGACMVLVDGAALQKLPRHRRRGRRAHRHHDRGPVARPLAPGAAGAGRRAGDPVRLLHARNRHRRRGAARAQRRSERGRDQAGDPEPVPLRGLSPADPRRAARRPRGPPRRADQRRAAARESTRSMPPRRSRRCALRATERAAVPSVALALNRHICQSGPLV